jgi:hypothetical protein
LSITLSPPAGSIVQAALRESVARFLVAVPSMLLNRAKAFNGRAMVDQGGRSVRELGIENKKKVPDYRVGAGASDSGKEVSNKDQRN